MAGLVVGGAVAQETTMEELEQRRARADAQAAAAAQRARDDAPAFLRDMSPLAFCAAYGVALRTNIILGAGEMASAPALVRAEAKRRKLAFDDKQVIAKRVRLGGTRCALYAAWGEPEVANRTVTVRGEHVQHVYGGAYVYTERGVVTAYQD